MRPVIPTRRRRLWIPVAGVIVLAVIAVVVWTHSRAGDELRPGPTATAAGTHAYDGARQLLDGLPIKRWDREQDFSRYRFGEAWSDEVNVEFGHNGCNTRDDILRRDLVNLVVRPGTCYAQSGVLRDRYTSLRVEFVRGPDTSDTVQIDHVVSLADAWYKGARHWDDQRRLDFANDPRNLLAVGAQANFDKAFRDATGWLPPNVEFRCEFVTRQVEVKAAYQLWVSANEKQAMADVLRDC